MSSTFSTVINFGMLGLMRRLHRLHIQMTLQAQSSETGVIFPQVEKHKVKDGKNVYVVPSLQGISDENIAEAVSRAQIRAKESIEELGMSDLLKEHKKWDSAPFLDTEAQIVEDSDSEGEDECSAIDESIVSSLVQEVCIEDSSDIASDINKLSDGLISPRLQERLSKLQQSLPKLSRLSCTSIPMYAQTHIPYRQAAHQ